MKKTLCLLGMAACLATSASASIVLYDDFTNGDLATGDTTDVNGGFWLVSNDTNGDGTVGESGGNATIATAADSFDNSGIVSINSFDASAAASISATWVVSSQTTPEALNGTEFLLQGGTSNGTGDGSGFRTGPFIRFSISGSNWTVSDSDGSTLGSGALGATSAVADGYEFTLNMSETGWGIVSDGFGSDISLSDQAYSGTFDFSDLQTDLYASSMIQANKYNTSRVMNIDSVSVSVNVIPEPSTIGMLGLGTIITLLLRRHMRS